MQYYYRCFGYRKKYATMVEAPLIGYYQGLDYLELSFSTQTSCLLF